MRSLGDCLFVISLSLRHDDQYAHFQRRLEYLYTDIRDNQYPIAAVVGQINTFLTEFTHRSQQPFSSVDIERRLGQLRNVVEDAEVKVYSDMMKSSTSCTHSLLIHRSSKLNPVRLPLMHWKIFKWQFNDRVRK